MPKVKFQVGAEFDVLSKDELDKSLESSVHKFAKLLSSGVGFGKAFYSNINSAAANNSPALPTTPTYAGGYIFLGGVGPEPGYMWSIKNITYLNFPTTGADLLINGYSNGDIAYALVNGANANGTTIIGSNGLIVQSGNDLYLGFRGTVTNAAVVVYYEEVLLEDMGKL